MENKEKNKSLIIAVILLLVVSVILIILSIVLLNKYEEQKQTIAELRSEIEEQTEMEEQTEVKKYTNELLEILDENAEDYLRKIGLISNKELPVFENINDADPNWIWENVRYCFQLTGEENFNYDKIKEYTEMIYGNEFNLELPKDGGYGFIYDSKNDKYNIEEDEEKGENKRISFAMKNIEESNGEAYVEIVEYIVEEKYSDEEEGEVTELLLYDKNGNKVKSYKITNYDENNEEYNDEIINDYEEKLEELENDSKNLEATKRIKLQTKDTGIYNIVSISKIEG